MWEKDYAAEFFGNFECHVICTNRSNVYWYNNKGEFQTDSPDILFHAADEACKNAEIVGRYTKFRWLRAGGLIVTAHLSLYAPKHPTTQHQHRR